MSTKITVCKDETEIVKELCNLIEKQSNCCLEKTNEFKVGLSGGSLIKYLVNGLPSVKTDWTKWRFFFCDERLVPFDDNESTYGAYKRDFLSHVPVLENQFVVIDPTLEVEAAAADYQQKLEKHFTMGQWPKFDLLLLGVGPDGHTCSLFPGHPLLKEDKKWVAPINDSPKPPPCRVTLTLPVLNNAHCVIFCSTGNSKARTIKRILEGNEAYPLPAALVKPREGKLHWILDEGAAECLDRN
ncbi:6-phosphogluconolactonase-like [Limulus polyphemus]|uniref:6-phosphogluconolactonase n=1 Tax=Limulus polyphemus TaxID=6850 RepID=A0ABM1BJC5_LIMPO|nr:6-phosphogluconolactonase-like [Limulus polyphemus]